MAPEGRPERRPADLPRIRKAPKTDHPFRRVDPSPDEPATEDVRAVVPTHGGAVPAELKTKTEQTVPLSVRIPPSLMKRLRRCVYENETKMQYLVEFVLDEWLKQHEY